MQPDAFTFKFTVEDLKVLEMALLEVPTKFGAPLIAKINEQIRQQTNVMPTDTIEGDKK